MNSQKWWYITTLTKQIKSTIALPNKKRGRPPKIKDVNLSIPLGKLNENN